MPEMCPIDLEIFVSWVLEMMTKRLANESHLILKVGAISYRQD